MSNTRYLEIDSTYRNRNDWPLPCQFEIPISQTGRKNINNALDPVSISVPLQVWTSNNFNLIHSNTVTGKIILASTPTLNSIGFSGDNFTCIIEGNINTFQQNSNYYRNCIIVDTTNQFQSRITEYIYLYTNATSDVALITLSSPFPDTVISGDFFKIVDPTDISDPNNPYIFVPVGSYQQDGYTSFILFDETVNEYRKIINYNQITNMLFLDTTGSTIDTVNSGPVTNWSVSDNFSIRKQAPYINNSSSIKIQIGSTNCSLILNGLLISESNFYKGYSVRILPIQSGLYNFVLTPPINESSNIVNSSYDTITNLTTLIVEPPFTAVPVTDSLIEIMTFSYDNLYPFVYTGSLVSQQEMVCYEIQLLNLVLPNSILMTGDGGRIAFYPYVYVQLSNVSTPGAGLKNIIYSNNPNSTNATFRAPIYDIQNPLISSFIKIDGDNMNQTIKFKPNDNLFFTVYMSNGEIYQTGFLDTKSPAIPNPKCQISALFSIKRL